MKVYEFAGFPNPARVRIALAEKGLTDKVDFVSVNVPEGEHRNAEFLAKNPSGKVPALETEDGTVIAECTAITEYLDHMDGAPELTGKTPQERGVIHMMQRRAEEGLLDAVGAYFHHATPGLGPDIETVQFADWGNHQKDRAIEGMKYFNSVLEKQDYVAGDTFTMADITVFAGLAFAGFANIDVPAECSALKDWQSKVSSRPSFAA
ncbi:MAG: glutathione S-transferase [Rhizobiaceae bacterium]|nr:glutathione S-transferase [Rhizobiaceae bacterium]